MTFEEHRGPIRGKTVAWTGDGNNVLTSLDACGRALRLPAATSRRRRSSRRRSGCSTGCKSSGADIRVGTDPDEAVTGADCVVTDTWVSMGDKDGAAPPQPAQALPGQRPADGAGEARRAVHALPAGASRRGGDRRRDRRPAIGGVRRGGEPPARAERHPGLVPARTEPTSAATCSTRARDRGSIRPTALYHRPCPTPPNRHPDARTRGDLCRRHHPAVRGRRRSTCAAAWSGLAPRSTRS